MQAVRDLIEFATAHKELYSSNREEYESLNEAIELAEQYLDGE